MGDMADWSMQVDDEFCSQYGYVPRPRSPVGPGDCPKCGEETVLREGRYGEFYGCSTFPACKGTRKYDPDLVPPVSVNIQLVVTVKVSPHENERCDPSCRFLKDICEVGFGGYYCILFDEDVSRSFRCKGCLKFYED